MYVGGSLVQNNYPPLKTHNHIYIKNLQSSQIFQTYKSIQYLQNFVFLAEDVWGVNAGFVLLYLCAGPHVVRLCTTLCLVAGSDSFATLRSLDLISSPLQRVASWFLRESINLSHLNSYQPLVDVFSDMLLDFHDLLLQVG